jgi:hypothetical protein
VPGTVRISGGDDQRTYRVAADADGRFTTEVQAGTYVVTGRSPLFQGGRLDCRIAEPSVTVRTGDILTLDVMCHMK